MLTLIKKALYLSIFILFFSPFFSRAQDAKTILLEGTVGKASVVMEITLYGKGISGNYYYKRFKKNIPLEGKYIDAKTIELVYEHWGTKETFLLKDIGTQTEIIYTGTWKNEIETETGTEVKATLPVKLKHLDVAKIPARNSFVKRKELSEYEYSILAPILLIQDSIQRLTTEFSITWLRDTISDFRFFRINKNADINGIDSINILLEDLQFANILSFLDCQGSEYTSDISSVYIRGHVLSFAVSNSYECGGAHPDFGTIGYTFNLETGKRMVLTDFLYFGKTEADYPEGDSYKLGGEIMGPNIVKLLTKLYPEDMKQPDDEDESCDYSTAEVWDYIDWYLTAEGLYLYPYFPRVARCCDGAEFSTIPYKVLVKYKNPKVVIPMKY